METNWVKKKKIFSKLWFFSIFIFILILVPVACLTAWVVWAFAAPSSTSKEVVFVIKQNESIVSIARRLKDKGLIKDETAFRIFVRINCQGIDLKNPTTLLKKYPISECLGGNIQAGSFKLNPSMTLSSLAVILTKGKLDSWVKIIEGLRNEEVAEILQKQFSIKTDDYLKIAKIGYMFPDTYLFKTNSTAVEIAQKMRDTFDQKYTKDLQEKVKNQGLTVDQGVVLASIIQREAGRDVDAPLIASVFLNRLNIGMPLGADDTVQFALGYDQGTKTWWKKDLTNQDLNIDSPYNTRKVAGFPPGPICNPGLAALKSVAEPATSSYYYFLYGKDGVVHFAKTLTEHNANKIKYL